MNSPPLQIASPNASLGRSSLNPAVDVSRLTLSGGYLFVAALLVGASAFNSARISVAGMLVHPCLIAIALIAPFVLLSRIGDFPWKLLAGFVAFTLLTSISSFNLSIAGLSGGIKLGSSVLLIVIVALLVRSEADFVFFSLALSLAVAMMAVRGVSNIDDYARGASAIGGRNTYSFYALPTLLVAARVVIRPKATLPITKAVLIACVLAILVSVFLSGNRSGWLGAAAIGLMVLKGRFLGGFIFVAVVAASVFFYITEYASTKVIENRIADTETGNTADRKRVDLFLTAVKIGIENPVAGVGTQALQAQLGRGFNKTHSAPHNVIGQIIGASGLICFGVFSYVAWKMWFLPITGNLKNESSLAYFGRSTLRQLLFLWLLRGMFGEEILYTPAFHMAIGAAIGLYLTGEKATMSLLGRNAMQNHGVSSYGG